MTNQTKSIDALVEDASKAIYSAPTTGKLSTPNQTLTNSLLLLAALLLFVALVGFFSHVFPAYTYPDKNLSPEIGRADLRAINDQLEDYKLSNGRWPSSLDEAKIPAYIQQPDPTITISYTPSKDGYELKWESKVWLITLGPDKLTANITKK
ncbi:hypothetical protein HQ393_12855 [Chitinibacter bivalviorum]|uniref:Uncharacterized protein n=1 Tax=Chitinibacter bivalviorum TaxID=2739434 RepID=A0A7H9BL36_9NEIS|nr:hypothetical protein [Chitinibacter bivalviorum]QLG89056.1 hypothetical protein HQ393_12855 [Chitinibacter bivalviorum]